MFGAYGSFPRRFGGGPDELRIIHEDLLESYGTAFDKSRGTYLWALCYADARAIWAAWQTNARLRAQCNPATASWSLPIWEKSLGLSAYKLTIPQRRRQVVELEARQGQDVSYADIEGLVRGIMGDNFVEIRIHDPSEAVVHVPDGTYPWGTVDPGTPWYSTVSYLGIRLQNVASVNEGEFYERIGRMTSALNDRLNVWATFDWFTGDGFFLDIFPNHDLNSFDE